MDWDAAIEKNREALKRVLAMLVGMAGLVGGAAFTSPLWGSEGRARQATRPESEASGGGCALTITPTRRSDDRRPPHKGEVEAEFRPTLPRHLHRAVLRLLRPAEAAARRLIIVAARGIVVALPPARLYKPKPTAILRNGVGTGIVMPRNVPHPEVRGKAEPRRRLCLPLLDPLPRWGGSKRPAARGVPRICLPGLTQRFPVPSAPSPDDLVDATRLNLRLQALGRALDNLPREARRFARWRVARDAAGAQNKELRDAAGAQNGKSPDVAGAQNKSCGAAGAQNSNRGAGAFRRVWPLRPGRPPGGRRRPDHEVHDILNVVHGLAFWVLERPDTS